MSYTLYVTGDNDNLQAPLGVVVRGDFENDVRWTIDNVEHRGHVATTILEPGDHSLANNNGDAFALRVGPRRKPTHRFKRFAQTFAAAMDVHYWFHRCTFRDGLRVFSGARSILCTSCKFFGHVGLRLPDHWDSMKQGPTGPHGCVVVRGPKFKGNLSYGVFGPAEGFGCFGGKIHGAGLSNSHGIRIAGGHDVCLRDLDVSKTAGGFSSITIRDGVNSSGGGRFVFAHGTIADCRCTRGGLRRLVHVGPQNPAAADAGARVRQIDILNNKIKGDLIQWRSIVVAADRVNVIDNDLHSGPQLFPVANPVEKIRLGFKTTDTVWGYYGPGGKVKGTTSGPGQISRGHIHLRKMGAVRPSNVRIDRNTYHGSCTDVEGGQV